jgi:bifunctional DNase/RNase
MEIDSRTSDAIALAIRFGCPVYTYENIMVAAGILMEEDQEAAKPEDLTGDETLPEETSYSEYSLEDLNQMLQSAIENEEYEKAVRIRDELKKRK